jgi:ABC-type multidrug transport system ATPase subunit
MTSDLVVATSGLTRRFGAVLALDHLDLQLRAGEIHGFLGLNGAGKTTTLRLLTGLIRPSSGRIWMLGREVAGQRRPPLQEVGAFIEGPAFFGRLTGRENLVRLASLSGRVRASEADALLEEVGLAGASRRQARAYSLGMKQRLGLALALLPRPRLVLLDEPTNGLDPQGIHDVRRIILERHRREGTTFLISSHLLPEVEATCTRVSILRTGRLVREGPIGELLARTGSDLHVLAAPLEQAEGILVALLGRDRVLRDGARLRLRDAASAAARCVEALVAGGCAVHEVERGRASLADAFFAEAGG